MSSHLRHCPKHRKPLPCPHCALTVKSAQTAVALLEPEPAPVIETPSTPIPSLASSVQEFIIDLMDRVDAVEGDEKVRQVVRETLSSPGPSPELAVKRGRGRPRTPGKEYTTEAERKKVERNAVRTKLVLALDAFNLTVDTEITPESQTKYGTTAKTYGQLLKKDSKTLKKIIKLLQQETRLRHSTTGGVMTQAPRGKGKVVTGGYNTTKIDADQGSASEHQVMLSRQDGLLQGPDCPDSYSLLNNTVVLADGSRSTSDRKRSLPVGGSDKQFENANTRETDFTFMSKVRWPQSWFKGKYKPEYSEVADECMRQAINAFSHTEAREPGFEPEVGAVETAAQYCVLCDEKLGGHISTADHLLRTHLPSVQKFFHQVGVRFNRKHFGITDAT